MLEMFLRASCSILHRLCILGLVVGTRGGKGVHSSCVRSPNSCHGHAEILVEHLRHRVAIGLATPFMVDWNGDGRQDFFVGQQDGSVLYYQQDQGRLKVQQGEANPLHFMEPAPYDKAQGGYSSAAPVVVDWDSDGQLEILVATGGRVRFFKANERGVLVEADVNPFAGVKLGWVAGRFCVADWDEDGDLDLIASHGRTLDYYEQIDGRLVMRKGTQNPFLHVQGDLIADAQGWDGTYGAPFATDWDNDGDLDLILGQSDGSLWFYERMAHGLSRRSGRANPFAAIKNGYFASAQVIARRNKSYLLTGYQDGVVVMYQREMEVILRERTFSMNPFRQIGQLRNAVPAAPVKDSKGTTYFLFQETNVGSVQSFKQHADGRFENVTATRANTVPGTLWHPAGTPQYVDWNGDGALDRLTLFYNGTLLYEEGINGSFVEVRSQNPFAGLSFNKHFADSNVSGFLALDLRGGRMGLLVAEWGFSHLRFFETGWCELADPCKSKGVCGSNGICQCFTGYGSYDCSSCRAGFFTEARDLGERCEACPGTNSKNGTCSSRGWCFDDASAFEAVTENMSRLQREFLRGTGQCHCNEFFFGTNCDQGCCPPGFEHAEGQCFECAPGWHKPEDSNSALCRPCPEDSYANLPGMSQCQSCLGMWVAWSPNEAHTECLIDVVSSLLIAASVACWTIVFFLVPFIVGLPVIISDVVSHLGDVRLIAHGRHGVLRNRAVTVTFRDTGHPDLDSGEFRATWLSYHELSLSQKDGSPLAEIETSSGTFQVYCPHAIARTGMFGVQYSMILMMAVAYVGVFYSFAVNEAYVSGTRTLLLHACLGLTTGLVLHLLRFYALRRTRLSKEMHRFRHKLRELNPTPVSTRRGPHRAVTIGQLAYFYEFFKAHVGLNRNMHYVVHNILKPVTRPTQLSYAEVAGPSMVQWFVSHHWGTAFGHFLQAIRQHAISISPPSSFQNECYWICSFSNNQWKVDEEIGDTWDESSFYLAMRSNECQGTAMVFDDQAVTLTRAWCLFELLQTERLSMERTSYQGLMICTGQGIMNHGAGSLDLAMNVTLRLANLRLQDAQATKDLDKEMIDGLVLNSGGFEKVNAFLIQTLKKALKATQMRVRDDLESVRATLSVAELRSSTLRKSCSSKSSASPVKPGLRRSQSLNYQKVRSRQKLRYWSSRALSADAHTASTSLSSNHGKSYSSKPSAVLLGASSSCGPQKIDSLSSHCRVPSSDTAWSALAFSEKDKDDQAGEQESREDPAEALSPATKAVHVVRTRTS